jgi:hypothetical protein
LGGETAMNIKSPNSANTGSRDDENADARVTMILPAKAINV